ncbi:hypothetical protein CCM_03890 [Cordyceps militaris CM01]|uniref:Small acidic protein-like domain-containing protein n=1 Tax=Cordyceps militaris (strain CM01) TaxID=983644 RepID=G3JCY9_CORMM|nr:uncharacterized protein CCM_03890 [Cordyceps militaris CM01]EGX92517.1 hypothetical protein CCM_03890 [Cordyceps militaris CM01]
MAGTKPKTNKVAQRSKGKAKPGNMAVHQDTAKIEKKRAKLLARSQELEKEAHRLLAEAKKAADAYAELTKFLEEQDDDTSSEGDSDEDVLTSSSESTSSSSDSSSEGGAAIPAPKATPRRKCIKDKQTPERKRKRVSPSSSDDDDTSSSDSSDSDADQKAAQKKSTKDNKSKRKDKRNSKKNAKQRNKVKDAGSDSDGKETSAAGRPEGWHVTNLDGGPARQSKFLRLLGGKKQGVRVPEAGSSSKSASESARAEADIQRQFEEGMRMKNDGGSHRRGLGMSG